MIQSTLIKVFLLFAAASCAWAQSPAAANPSADDIAFFEAKIRPVLAEKCYVCHSGATKDPMAGLNLDSRPGMLRGGLSGPAIVPGEPDESLLIRAIRYEDRRMPPMAKLPGEVVADFEKWIAMGAPDPRDGRTGDGTGPTTDMEEGHKYWAFQPIRKPAVPKVRNVKWPSRAIDRFLLASMEQKGVEPVADADRATWLRRVTLDLVGLPPTLDEIETFARDHSPEAYAKVVDRLLASERFGERWARHWLDVARYAESVGPGRNYVLPFAWRYRNYVIQALNNDKPYDQFVKEQIAGDLLPFTSEKQHREQVTGTGFLTLGLSNLIEKKIDIFRMNAVDDQINVTTRAFMALTVGCARCHDHKFDPIPTSDYYALAGIFRSTEILSGMQRNPHDGATFVDINRLATLSYAPDEPQPEHIKDVEKLRRWEELQAQLNAILVKKKGPGINLRAESKPILTELDELPMPPNLVMAVHDASEITDCKIHIGGDVNRLGPAVPRGFVQAAGKPGEDLEIGPNESGRLQLAEWLARRENPLTARVAVNRIWHHMFGRGLVATLDNFGQMGGRPSHPELLDYLAASFMDQGWSVKKTIREIALSRAYRLGTADAPHNDNVDPDNVLHWRMSRRRLEVEAIRDSMLLISGQIDLHPPQGSPVFDVSRQFDLDRAKYKPPLDYVEKIRHRSIYIPVLRNFVPAMFQVFDFPEPSETKGRREVTTVPTQALFMMNSPFVIEQSHHAAARLLAAPLKETDRVRRSFREAFGRAPNPTEAQWALDLVRAPSMASGAAVDPAESECAAWGRLYQALFATAEFRYRN